ncbi:hypothetical protein YC2023_084863 [Brassica napus]
MPIAALENKRCSNVSIIWPGSGREGALKTDRVNTTTDCFRETRFFSQNFSQSIVNTHYLHRPYYSSSRNPEGRQSSSLHFSESIAKSEKRDNKQRRCHDSLLKAAQYLAKHTTISGTSVPPMELGYAVWPSATAFQSRLATENAQRISLLMHKSRTVKIITLSQYKLNGLCNQVSLALMKNTYATMKCIGKGGKMVRNDIVLWWAKNYSEEKSLTPTRSQPIPFLTTG